MGLTKRQREVVLGTILGDAYLQPTGKYNARLRLEHLVKRKEYIIWKYQILKNYMQSEPKLIKRYNPVWKKTYSYYRCQTYSSPEFGKYRKLFYQDSKKIIPESIASILKSALSLAVWYMDDGYYYARDRVAQLYLSNTSLENMQKLLECLDENFGLSPRCITKKKLPVIYFDSSNVEKLTKLVKPYIIPSMSYKFPQTP